MKKLITKFPFCRRYRKKSELFCFSDHKIIIENLILTLVMILIFHLGSDSIGWAQPGTIGYRQSRVIWSDELGIRTPSGLAYSSVRKSFYIFEASGKGASAEASSNINFMNITEKIVGSTHIGVGVNNPLNVTYDSKNNRLLILKFPSKKLIEISTGASGNLAAGTLSQIDVAYFGLQDPQGMTVDPASGNLFILDRAVPSIVRIDPDSEDGFRAGVVSTVDLNHTGLDGISGLAFDPTSRNLHLMNIGEGNLCELTRTGQIVETRNLSGFGLSNLQGMVFAPSGDLTDDPLRMSLYIADLGPLGLERQINSALGGGRIIELLLIRPLSF